MDQAQAAGGPAGGDVTAEQLTGKMKAAEEALLLRPTISIRFRLVVGFLLCFFLAGAMAIATVVILYQVRFKLHFLETAESMTYEVQQARRFEKNYFLYGTDLKEALNRAEVAKEYLQANAGNILEVAGQENLASLTRQLGRYVELLTTTEQLERTGGWRPGRKEAIEAELREHGAKIVDLAATLTIKERAAVERMIKTSQVVPFVCLGVLLLLILYIVNFLAGGIMAPLRRFQGYTRRIAEGDFSPILPARRYRDEFSDLAMALNRMLIQIKTHEEKCVEAGKMAAVGMLTSGVAHELNNPLNNISITTEALMEDFKTLSDEQKWKLLQDIYFETERASETVKSLLDFTRSERLSMVPLDLAEVIQGTARLVQNEMSLSNVDFSAEIPADLPKVLGAANQLRQAFLNLLINAVQAMPKGGKLTVTATRAGPDRVAVKVCDQGTGIPPDVIPHIFDPFFTTKEPGKGTGLGLSVSYSIVKKHGGDIGVESVPGSGATFRVTLPLAVEA